MTEIENQGRLILLRRSLSSGHVQQVVKQAGLTQRDVAAVIGVSPASVSLYFKYGRMPRRRAALRLVDLVEKLEVVNASH